MTAAVYVNLCLIKIIFLFSVHMCAPQSELPPIFNLFSCTLFLINLNLILFLVLRKNQMYRTWWIVCFTFDTNMILTK